MVYGANYNAMVSAMYRVILQIGKMMKVIFFY